MSDISPRGILKQVADAIPQECHKNIIVVGSLAAGFHLLPESLGQTVRTKDIDCVLSPYIEAIQSGKAVTETLLANGWRLRLEAGHGEPGTSVTAESDLPAIRLYPPDTKEWFVKFLMAPQSGRESATKWRRIIIDAGTSSGHYGLPSFRFLSLQAYDPIRTEFGIRCARPEMMAMGNMLEHRTIGLDMMSGIIGNRRLKRSNKDLGRVLAIGALSTEEAVQGWPDTWENAIKSCFPDQWRQLAGSAGSGMRHLLKSEDDFEEAWYTCVNGLLAARELQRTKEQLLLIGRRLMQDAILPLEERAIRVSRQ